MARDETTREVLSEAQLVAALTAYRECEAYYLHAATDEEGERAAINGFWNARNIIPTLLAKVEWQRAALDAQGKLVELLAAEAWHGSNAPYYAEMRRILEAHKRAWHTLSESKQRSGGDGG